MQAVFDEAHQEREAQRQADIQAKLDAAVKDGKISQDKATQLSDKLKELDSFRDTLKDKTHDERHTAMKAKMDEFQKWLKDNNIDMSALGIGPGGHMRGHGMRGGMMDDGRGGPQN